jgi:hypothetical protein
MFFESIESYTVLLLYRFRFSVLIIFEIYSI